MKKIIIMKKNKITKKKILKKTTLTKKKGKGFYGVLLETFVLKNFYLSDYKSGNKEYDLPACLNKIDKTNVSVKSFREGTIYLSDAKIFLKSKNLTLILIKYKLLSKNKIKILGCYKLEKTKTKCLLKHCNLINKKKLEDLRNFFFSLSYKTVTKAERNKYIALSREIGEKNLLVINCKLSRRNHRIQSSMSFAKLNSFFFLKKDDWLINKYTGYIIDIPII